MSPIIFLGTVIDVDDPLNLGRIRVELKINNIPDVLKAAFNSIPLPTQNFFWTNQDPFLMLPLIPYLVYQVPKNGELVQIIFQKPEFMFQNQYYVQSNFYSVNSIYDMSNAAGEQTTGIGMQFEYPKPIYNPGLYPKPGDSALLGRGSADLIIKDTTSLLRAGKYSAPPQSNIVPEPNNNRAFVQLSQLDITKVGETKQKIISNVPVTLSVKHLIEWVIDNPENQIVDPITNEITNKFGGSVSLYSLKESKETNTNEIGVSTKILERNKYLIYSSSFFGLNIQQTQEFINNFIKNCNDKNTAIDGSQLFSETQNKFPIYFRPAPYMYELISKTIQTLSGTIISQNLENINRGIKFQPADGTATSDNQFGLIWKKDTTGLPTQTQIKEITTDNYQPKPRSVSVVGGQEIYLLSQNSAKDGLAPINFANSLYGIEESAFTQDIQAKTSSTVRGEELLDLINLMYQVLISHVHAFDGLPTVRKTRTVSLETLEAAIRNAKRQVLNTNIRVN